MSIMPYIFWLLMTGNALFAQGWHYDPFTNTWTDPAGAAQPAPTPQTLLFTVPERTGKERNTTAR